MRPSGLRVAVGDRGSAVILSNRAHLGIERDAVRPNRAREGFRDLVHAADRMEHRRRRRALAGGNGPDPVAESRLQERAQLVGIAWATIFKSLVAPVARIEVALCQE